MRKNLILILISGMLLAACSGKNKNPQGQQEINPFLTEWDTPYQTPPFDKIKTEHYIPAFEEGMKQHKAEIDAIINNTEAPTFANTIEAMDCSGKLLTAVSRVFFNMTETNNSPEMEQIAKDIKPQLSAHNDEIKLNPELFAKVKTVYEQKEQFNLNPEQMRLLEETYKGFVKGGANIPVEKQARFKEINQKLALLNLTFGNNVLKATNAYQLVVDDKAKLEGLTEGQLSAAEEAGNANEATKGKWVFTTHNASLIPFLTNCSNRELRKELWTAYATRCTSGEFDNVKVIDEIVNLALEKAQILGYKSYADYVLDFCMAKTPAAVDKLLMNVWRPAIAKAKQEASDYQKMVDTEGGKFTIEPCDWRYYAEKLRKEKYDLDEETIRPYFSLDNVREGIFTVCNKLYGLTFKENKDIPVYDKEATAYEVIDNGEVIAILYMDFFPRESKRSGAWMTNFREQHYDKEGKNVIPIISLVCNFTKPTATAPSLLTFDEAETFFHEFGHGLHGMLSKCHYISLAGTNVDRDFVELPSQIMENWAREPEVLKMYAKHYQTGEVIPDELIKKLQNAATYGQGFQNVERIAASVLDMDYYTLTQPTKIVLPEFEDNAMKKIGLIPQIISRYKSTYFQHIFSGNGYDAGYYSYTWAAVLDSDAFELFKEKGIFDQTTANSFRHNILERGNTEDPMKLYVKFRGQEPSIDPLLKKNGLK